MYFLSKDAKNILTDSKIKTIIILFYVSIESEKNNFCEQTIKDN